MAEVFSDTNLLLRLADSISAGHDSAAGAMEALDRAGHTVFITPQCLIEFWAVTTRPLDANGFGWGAERASHEVEFMKNRFPMLPDCEQI